MRNNKGKHIKGVVKTAGFSYPAPHLTALFLCEKYNE
jgi:hypothetical protein